MPPERAFSMAMPEAHDHRPAGRALPRLIAGVDLDFSLSVSEQPHAVRRRLQAALDSPDLFLDCARLLLSQVLSDPGASFLFLDPQSRYTLQLFCWPPGFGNQPHLHTTWNVSAVFAGSLLVFRSAISAAECLAAEPLPVAAGQAGVLIPPQFHYLRNPGREAAITFHLFSLDEARNDRLHLERLSASEARLDDEGILAIAAMAAAYGGAQSIEILGTAFDAAGTAAKLEVVKLMAKLDLLEAVGMGKRLSQLVGGHDGRRLLGLVERLEAAHGGNAA